MTKNSIEVDGVSLHVEEDGDGAPLVLVNGAFCCLRQWDRVVPSLAERFRVMVQRGVALQSFHNPR